jgi:signal transduction histidine kinase
MAADVDWDGPSQTRFLERIDSESARLGRLVEDLLDFSAIDAGLLRLNQDWCELPLVLEAARSCLAGPQADSVSVSCPPEVPVLWADHDRLEQVFVNLFDNAVRHNPPGTAVRADVHLSDDGQVTVTVSDDGTGIPAERLTHLSSPGERRGRSGGSGLGLSIAKGIVEAHGGQLNINADTRGTVAQVRLPLTSSEVQVS